jgi:hypothetical protein
MMIQRKYVRMTKSDRFSLKNIDRNHLTDVLSVKTLKLFNKEKECHENPVVRAHHIWSIVSDQLNDILGESIFRQWFQSIRPIVISEDMLILGVPNNLTALWIKTHYQKLVDLLLNFIDSDMTVYFLSPEELGETSKTVLKGPSTKVDRSKENS